jgi:hypothetical protein
VSGGDLTRVLYRYPARGRSGLYEFAPHDSRCFSEAGRQAGGGADCPAILFGLDHFCQRTAGMVDVGIYGLVYGTIFLVARRNLWANALAHGLLDALAFTVLYLGLITT